MPRGNHITHCQYCLKEYICGDCITNECELGRGNKKSCEGYKQWLSQEMARANLFNKMAKDSPTGKRHAVGVIMADVSHENIAKELTNAELAEAVLKEVWAELPIGSRKGALIVQCIERLRGKSV